MFSPLFKSIFDGFVKWLKQLWFESKLKARLDMIEIENRIQAELEQEEKNKPIYREYPIDQTLQTGESQKLGGEMSLTAPWYDELESKREDGKS